MRLQNEVARETREDSSRRMATLSDIFNLTPMPLMKTHCCLPFTLPACLSSILVPVVYICFWPLPCSLSPDFGHRGQVRAKQPTQGLGTLSRFQKTESCSRKMKKNSVHEVEGGVGCFCVAEG